MKLITSPLAALLLVTSTMVQAAPADLSAAVAAKGRPDDAVALDAGRKPVQVLKFLGLKKGDRVLDLLTGGGYYAEIIGRAVGPQGSVTAWQPNTLIDLDKFSELLARQPNVQLQIGALPTIAFAPKTYDFVLMHITYHDLYWESEERNWPRVEPSAVLKVIYSATKPGGIIAVVDHVANPGGDTRAVVDKLHRIDPAVIRADFERAGFRFEGESDLLRMPADDHSLLVFDKSIRGKTDRVVYRFRKPR